MELVRAMHDEEEHHHHHHHHEDEGHHHHDEEDEEHGHHHDDDEECCHHHHDEDEEEHGHHHDHDGHHHHHHADEVFTSWGLETPASYTEEQVRSCLRALEDEEKYGIVLRAKGMVPAQDGAWIYFDYVPGEVDVRAGAPDVTGKICVIGSKLREDALTELFRR